jgi:hypothetical protein
VATDDDPGLRLAEAIDGPEGRDDPEIVGYLSVLERDVEIGSHQHPTSVDIEIIERQIGFGGHGFDDSPEASTEFRPPSEPDSQTMDPLVACLGFR